MSDSIRRLGLVTATLLVMMATVLWSVEAFSYTMNQTKDGKAVIWCKAAVVVYVDTTHVKHIPGVVDAVKAAYATWTSFGVPTKVKVVAVKKRLSFDSYDDKNVVRWEKGEWKWPANRVAKTVWRAGANSGCIKEADIILNAKTFGWGVFAEKPHMNKYDVQNVLAHEVGHFFGLDHSALGEATMYSLTPQGETSKRSLSQDDLNGIVYVVQNYNQRYTSVSTTGPGETEPDQLSGCSMSGDGTASAPWLLALMTLLGLSRWRRGSRER